MTDTPKQIKDKINKHAFSGGGRTLEEHRENGGNLKKDIPYNYLTYFLEDDDQLEHIAKEYSSGRMMTSEIKTIMINVIQQYVANHQLEKAKVTDRVIDNFYDYNKEFDNSLPIRETIELHSQEEYNKMGINYNRYFESLNVTVDSKESSASEN